MIVGRFCQLTEAPEAGLNPQYVDYFWHTVSVIRDWDDSMYLKRTAHEQRQRGRGRGQGGHMLPNIFKIIKN